MEQLLNSDGLKFFSFALSVACSLVMVFCPAGSVAYKLAEVLVPLLAGHGAVSSGVGGLKSSSSALTVARTAPMPVVAQAAPSGPTVAQQAPPDDIFQGGGG